MYKLLNLPQLNVEKAIEDSGGIVFFATADRPPQPCCATPRFVKNGTKRVFYLDLPIRGKHVSIWVNRRRWSCKACQSTVYQNVPHMDKNHAMTERLVRYIEKVSMQEPFTGIAHKLGVSEGTIRLIFRAYATHALAHRSKPTPRWIGIGPVNYLSQPRTVITDVEGKALLEFLPSPNEEALIEFLRGLPGKENIQWITTAMCDAYRNAIRAVLPHARIMVDRFHLAKLANGALERIGRGGISPISKRGLARNNRHRILCHPERLKPTQRALLDAWLVRYPRLKAAFEAKERYRALWENASREQAQARYAEWQRTLSPDIAAAFQGLIETTDAWREEILAFAAWDGPAQRYSQCVRKLQRKLNRLGQSYSFEVVRAKWLLRSETDPRPFVPAVLPIKG